MADMVETNENEAPTVLIASEAPFTASANEEEGPAKPDKTVPEEGKAEQSAETEENKAEEEGEMAEAKPTPEEISEKISSLVAEGKRDLFSLEYENASVKLGEAAELSAETYGQYAPEGYEAHFYYGKAKYEASRLEGEVIQKTLAGVNEEDEDADGENSAEDSVVTEQEMAKIREDVVDAMSEESREDGDKTKEGEVGKKEELVEKPQDGEKKEAEGNDKEEGAEKQEKEEETEKDSVGCDDEENEDEEEDELSNLQVAWEVFEVAKKICEGQPQEELWLLRLADVHIQLALCGMEDENLSSAAEDLKFAETTLQKIDDNKTTRLQIEICYHFAKLRSLSNDYVGCADYFKKAKDLINRKLAEFDAKGDQLTKEDSVMKEDLKGSLPDVESYIEEAIENEKSFQKVKAELKSEVFGTLTGLLDPNEGKEANDISGLVRKKRPAEELNPEGKEEADGEPQVKRGKSEEGDKETAKVEPIEKEPKKAEESKEAEAMEEGKKEE